jgi:hypothetical protein
MKFEKTMKESCVSYHLLQCGCKCTWCWNQLVPLPAFSPDLPPAERRSAILFSSFPRPSHWRESSADRQLLLRPTCDLEERKRKSRQPTALFSSVCSRPGPPAQPCHTLAPTDYRRSCCDSSQAHSLAQVARLRS